MKVVSWLIVFGYVFSLFFYAGREESSAGFTADLLAKWLPNLSPAEIKRWVFVIRKIGHVLAYAVLTLIVYSATRRTKKMQAFGLPFALVFTFIVAILDERYQIGLPHRTGSWLDVALDGIGIALVGLGIWLKTREKPGTGVQDQGEEQSN